MATAADVAATPGRWVDNSRQAAGRPSSRRRQKGEAATNWGVGPMNPTKGALSQRSRSTLVCIGARIRPGGPHKIENNP